MINNGVKGKQVAMWIYLLGVCLFALESIGVTIGVLVFLIENEFERFFAALLILILGIVVAFAMSLPLFGLGVLVYNSSIIAENTSLLVDKVNLFDKLTTSLHKKEEQERPTKAESGLCKKVDAPSEKSESIKATRFEAKEQKASKPLSEELAYALQYSTDDGMKRYLNGVLEKLSAAEQEELKLILAAPQTKLRAAINEYLNSKKEA